MPRQSKPSYFQKLLLALIVTTICGFSQPGLAANDGDVHGDWKIGCESVAEGTRKVCHMFQRLTRRDNGKQILHVAFGYVDRKLSTIMRLQLGVELEYGLKIQVDKGKVYSSPFKNCQKGECRAGSTIGGEFLNQLKKGSKMFVRFALADKKGKTFTVPISLGGFTAALASISKN